MVTSGLLGSPIGEPFAVLASLRSAVVARPRALQRPRAGRTAHLPGTRARQRAAGAGADAAVAVHYGMPQDLKEQITRRLRPELEKVPTVSGEEVDTVINAFTLLDSSSPKPGHVQYRLLHVDPQLEGRSDIADAIERAIHAAGYYVAGEE